MNAKYLKGVDIMFRRDMAKIKRKRLEEKFTKELSRNNRMKNIIRIDIEAMTTRNAYSEDGEELLVNRLEDDDEELDDWERDARLYYNKSCYPISESNLRETNQEFQRRQDRIFYSITGRHLDPATWRNWRNKNDK